MWFYNFGLILYVWAIRLVAPRHPKARLWIEGRKDLFRRMREAIAPTDRIIWIHVASLGEFEQGRPIIEQLRKTHPEYKILLTFFSPSGYEVRKDYKGADIVCYLPLDTIRNSRRFLRAVRPVMAFFIKYEFWYNYFHILQHRGVPIYSVSSIFRKDQVFFRWYGKQYGKVLSCVTRFFVQNEESSRLLRTIGIDASEVVGDTRFDRVLQIRDAAKPLPIVDAFRKGRTDGGDGPEHKVFVAGSSWGPDEDIFIRYFNEHPEWRLIIAPHVISEDHLKQILSKLNRKTVRYTQTTPEEAAQAECLIIDCFGLLSSVYNYGDVAYVGGGFGVGIHNVLEAAVWSMPVFFGPNNAHFQEAQWLKASQGGIEISSYDDFAAMMNRFIADPKLIEERGKAAAEVVDKHTGATEAILKAVGLK